MTKILVVGATGVLGQQVVLQLRARGVSVRALVRDPAKAPALVASGVEVVEGDLTDPVTLQRACSGASHVLAAAHGLLGRGRQRSELVDDAGHRALIAAARSAAVERFVYTSAYGAAPDHPIDFFRTKWAIEQVLAASGLDHVILRPTAFMEHHAHNFNGAGLLAKGKAQLIGRGTELRNFIAAPERRAATRCGLDVHGLACQPQLLEPGFAQTKAKTLQQVQRALRVVGWQGAVGVMPAGSGAATNPWYTSASNFVRCAG